MTANTAATSKHVLVVTADADYADSCRTELHTREGLHVETTDTVDAATGRLKQEDDIDCVISDHDLPDVDGIAFVEAVRIAFPDVPFILFTSEGSERVASRAIHAGATDYLIKERHRNQWDRLDKLINESIEYYRTRFEIVDPHTHREALLGAIPDMVGVVKDGTFQYVNPAGVELTGVDSPEELIGTALLGLFVETNELTREELDAVQRGDRYIGATTEQLIGVSGDVIPVEVTLSRISWEGAEAVLAILANRSERASLVNRLRDLKRINSLMRQVNRSLVKAASRAEIDQRVCELLSDSDPYRFAWIAEIDDATGDMVPRAWAGIEKRHLDVITDTNGEKQTAQGPTGRAIRTRELQVMQDIPNDPQYEPWRTEALDRGYRSRAAIPLVFEDEMYGVLNVYADRIGAFDKQERDLLREVGDDIAFALHRFDVQEKLRQSQAAIEQAADAIFLTDTEGTIEYVNPAFEALTGYSADEAIGRNPRILKSGEQDEEYYEEMWETILAGEIWSSEIINERKSGERYHAEQTVAPIATNEIEGFVAIQRDITDRKELQADLEESLTQLQVIDRVLRHNLHNDMNVIQGYAETIQSEAEGELADRAAMIVEESKDLLNTVSKERQITELLSEQHRQEAVALDYRINATVEEIQDQYPAAEVTVEQSGGVTVSATESLDQALIELLTNAIIHSDRDTPTIDVTVEEQPETVSIHIADDGPGIPEMEQRIITDEVDIDPLYHASGLGLWLVKLIVEESGGGLSFEEHAPRGSIVTITLAKPIQEGADR